MHLSFGREDVFFEELWTLGNYMTCQETIIHDKGYDVFVSLGLDIDTLTIGEFRMRLMLCRAHPKSKLPKILIRSTRETSRV